MCDMTRVYVCDVNHVCVCGMTHTSATLMMYCIFRLDLRVGDPGTLRNVPGSPTLKSNLKIQYIMSVADE